MGEQLKRIAWIWGGIGVVVCALLGARGAPWGLPLVALGAFGFGGLGVVLTRRFALGGRFGGKVVVEGGPALLFGAGLLVLAAVAPWIALLYMHREAYPRSRTAVGLVSTVVGVGLMGAGGGIGAHFVREDWRRRARSHPIVRVMSAAFMAWAFGFIGFVGVGLVVAGMVILFV